jgi:hypothetical protein
MGTNGVLLSRDDAARRADAAHRAQVLAEIGRRSREQYGLAQPMSDRLAELIGKIERSGSPTAVELKPG